MANGAAGENRTGFRTWWRPTRHKLLFLLTKGRTALRTAFLLLIWWKSRAESIRSQEALTMVVALFPLQMAMRSENAGWIPRLIHHFKNAATLESNGEVDLTGTSCGYGQGLLGSEN